MSAPLTRHMANLNGEYRESVVRTLEAEAHEAQAVREAVEKAKADGRRGAFEDVKGWLFSDNYVKVTSIARILRLMDEADRGAPAQGKDDCCCERHRHSDYNRGRTTCLGCPEHGGELAQPLKGKPPEPAPVIEPIGINDYSYYIDQRKLWAKINEIVAELNRRKAMTAPKSEPTLAQEIEALAKQWEIDRLQFWNAYVADVREVLARHATQSAPSPVAGLAESQCDICGHLYTDPALAAMHEGDHPGHKVLPPLTGPSQTQGAASPAKDSPEAESPLREWVSVKDRLPDKTCECLVFTPDDGYSSASITASLFVDGHFEEDDDLVTHWMPLPEPPRLSEGRER